MYMYINSQYIRHTELIITRNNKVSGNNVQFKKGKNEKKKKHCKMFKLS